MQLHNIQLALQHASLEPLATPLGIAPEDFADGDRGRTLAALWRLFCTVQVPCHHRCPDESAVMLPCYIDWPQYNSDALDS